MVRVAPAGHAKQTSRAIAIQTPQDKGAQGEPKTGPHEPFQNLVRAQNPPHEGFGLPLGTQNPQKTLRQKIANQKTLKKA